MSLLKGVASFIVSSLFITSLYLAITSYTTGNLMQKESIKNFLQSQMEQNIAPSTCEEMCNDEFQKSCENYCNNSEIIGCLNACLTSSHNIEVKQGCIQSCTSRANESEQYINSSIDGIYSNKIIAGISLNDAMQILKNNILFVIMSILFGVLLFFVSEKPVKKIGKNIAWVGVSTLSIATLPVFLIGSDMSIVKIISDYLMQNFYTQLIIGIILIVTGIFLMFIGNRITNKKKK